MPVPCRSSRVRAGALWGGLWGGPSWRTLLWGRPDPWGHWRVLGDDRARLGGDTGRGTCTGGPWGCPAGLGVSAGLWGCHCNLQGSWGLSVKSFGVSQGSLCIAGGLGGELRCLGGIRESLRISGESLGVWGEGCL